MVLNVFRRATMCCRPSLYNNVVRSYGIYEPPYIKIKPPIPIYPVLNIQLRGYVYPVLENYQRFIDKIANVLDITINDCFAYPHREFEIKRYEPAGTKVASVYKLKIYERDIQVSNVTVTKCPIFIRLLEQALPEGVSLSIDKYDPMLAKKRLIPDVELIQLKADLSEFTKS